MKRFLILRSLLAVVATMLVSLTPAAARAPEHKLDQALRGAGRGGVHRVIVRTTSAGNIVCSMADHDIVWGENIVWGEGLIRAAIVDNIVWSMFDDDMARAMTDVIAAAR